METGGWRTGNVSQRLPWGCIQQNFCTNGKVKAAKRVSRYIYVYIIILSAWATPENHLRTGFRAISFLINENAKMVFSVFLCWLRRRKSNSLGPSAPRPLNPIISPGHRAKPLTDGPTDPLTDWLTDRLTDGLADSLTHPQTVGAAQ